MSKNPKQTQSQAQIDAARAALQDTTYRDFAEYNDDYTMSSIDNGLGRGNTQQAKRRQDDFLISNPLGAPWAYEENNWFEDFMDNVFPALMVGTVAAGTLAVGGSLLFGGVGAAGTGAAGAAGSGTAAAGTTAAAEAAAGLGGLGSAGTVAGTTLGTTVGASGIPTVVISGTAGGAGGLGGLGTAAAVGGGLGGLAAIGSGGAGAPPFDPNAPIQSVEVPRPDAPPSSVPDLPYADLGAGIGIGSQLPINNAALEQLPNVQPTPSGPVVPPPVTPGPGAFPNLPLPSFAIPDGVTPGTSPTTPSIGGNIPGNGFPGLEDLIKGLIPVLGGFNDKKKAEEDSAWWKSQLDELSGMYKPGTLEATQMEQKMQARDAAAGRNSQYGIRAVNLASNLAEKRSSIMTSAGYQNMANAYRNRSSQDLNGLFAAAGNPSTQNTITGLINGLGGLFKG